MGPLERRLAKHAHDVNVGLPLVRLLEERVDDIPPADLPIPDTLPGEVIEEGEDLTQVLLSGPSRNLPSPGELPLAAQGARLYPGGQGALAGGGRRLHPDPGLQEG